MELPEEGEYNDAQGPIMQPPQQEQAGEETKGVEKPRKKSRRDIAKKKGYAGKDKGVRARHKTTPCESEWCRHDGRKARCGTCQHVIGFWCSFHMAGATRCTSCNQRVCDDCAGACDAGYCENRACKPCLKRCKHCGGNFCRGPREDWYHSSACTDCREHTCDDHSIMYTDGGDTRCLSCAKTLIEKLLGSIKDRA